MKFSSGERDCKLETTPLKKIKIFGKNLSLAFGKNFFNSLKKSSCEMKTIFTEYYYRLLQYYVKNRFGIPIVDVTTNNRE